MGVNETNETNIKTLCPLICDKTNCIGVTLRNYKWGMETMETMETIEYAITNETRNAICRECDVMSDACPTCNITLCLCDVCNGVATRIVYTDIGSFILCDDCNPSPEPLEMGGVK